jgi:glycogen operon protein
VNFITAHDGFTLHDLVTYNEKHNEANGEDNNDGEDHNRSCNYGVEGETDDERINSLRSQQKRNFLATLFLSQGVPMLVAGDEFSRTQGGNNNAYCQDNEISWLNWASADKELLQYTQKLIEMRKQHPVFCRRKWFQGQPIKGSGVEDIAWFLPEGDEMQEHNWNEDFAKSLAVFLNGKGIRSVDAEGNKIIDDSFYVIFNAHHEGLQYKLPEAHYGDEWKVVLDTSNPQESGQQYSATSMVDVGGRTVVVLKAGSK